MIPPVEAPRGMYPARLDDKGRLKLPVPFQQYLGSLAEKKLFVTSLDRHIAQIYPISVWRENEKFFDDYRDDPDGADDIWFNASDLGADADMDGQGRITFNPDLRRELGLENSQLRLYAKRGVIEILNEAWYQARRQRAADEPSSKLNTLRRAGLR